MQLTIISFKNDDMGGMTHGAVYIGTSENGIDYFYTKNGSYTAPTIMSLDQLIEIYGNDFQYWKLQEDYPDNESEQESNEDDS